MKLRINEAIMKSGHLKKYVAKEIGIDPNTLSRYINGKRRIPFELAIKLAEVLNYELSDLYEK